VAKYIGRHTRFLDGSPQSPELQGELKTLFNAYHTVKCLRRDYLGRFGDAPGGFHSATGDQLLYFKTFGTTVNTVDLLRVREVYDGMETDGLKGTQKFSEEDILKTQEEMSRGRLNLLSDQTMLYNGARLYHTLRAIIRAEGFKKTPNAILSRGLAGIRGHTLIINLPGSPKAVRESLEILLDVIPHAVKMIHGGGH